MEPRLAAVNVAAAITASDSADLGCTGIDKRPVAGRVAVRESQVAGDHIADLRHHGGYDQAVYAYAREDAAWWAGELRREVPPGAFGENLSTEGLDVTGAVIGERWAIGSALLEVSSPRIPCRTFAGFWDVRDLIKRFTARAWPGAYLRILTEGEIGAGDAIEVTHRPAHGVTIGETFRCFTGERPLAQRVASAEELPERHRDRLHGWLSQPA
jgi:MOSC domain-containing protein YiiM